jgi:hypothetical protein
MSTDRRASAPRQRTLSQPAKPLPSRRLGDLDRDSFDQFMQRLLADVERQRLDAVLKAVAEKASLRPALALA